MRRLGFIGGLLVGMASGAMLVFGYWLGAALTIAGAWLILDGAMGNDE